MIIVAFLFSFHFAPGLIDNISPAPQLILITEVDFSCSIP